MSNYATGTQLLKNARGLVGTANTYWPDDALAIEWINDCLVEAQGLTGYRKIPVSTAYTTPWASANITAVNIELVKLVSVTHVTLTYTKYEVVPLGKLLTKRAEVAAAASAAPDPIWFAINYYPTSTIGTVSLEVCPVFSGNTSVMVTYEDAPPALTAIGDTAYFPRDAVAAYLAWKMSISHAQHKQHLFRVMFEEAVIRIGTALGVGKRPEMKVLLDRAAEVAA